MHSSRGTTGLPRVGHTFEVIHLRLQPPSLPSSLALPPFSALHPQVTALKVSFVSLSPQGTAMPTESLFFLRLFPLPTLTFLKPGSLLYFLLVPRAINSMLGR